MVNLEHKYQPWSGSNLTTVKHGHGHAFSDGQKFHSNQKSGDNLYHIMDFNLNRIQSTLTGLKNQLISKYHSTFKNVWIKKSN